MAAKAGDGEPESAEPESAEPESAEATADREIVVSRVIDGPRELVFEAFTDLRHLSRWWGPDGVTTTTRAFEFREGGVWDFVLHAPDGNDYPNWILWREIVRPERIRLLHGNGPDDPDAFETTLTFRPRGETTELVLRTVFPTKELRDRNVEQYRAIERGEQTLGRLADYATGVLRTQKGAAH